MKVSKYLFSIVTALLLMISAPIAMACGSCHVDTGVLGYQAVNVIDVGKVDPTDKLISTKKINANSMDLVETSVVSVPIMAYSKPRANEGYEGFMKVNKLNAGATANKQAKPYAGVTAA